MEMTIYPALQKYQIPYEISSAESFRPKLQEFISINEQLTRKSRTPKKDIVRSLRKKWIKGLDQEESEREKNYVEACNTLESHKKFSIACAKEMNGLFLGQSSPSEFRDCRLFVKDSQGNVEREFPPHESVPELMIEAMRYLGENKNVLSAFIVHFLILSIHPFIDGNGRVARAAEWLILREHGLQFHPDWNPEVIMHWQASRYNQVLESCRRDGCVDDFVSFMLEGYLDTGRALIL